MAEDSQQSGRGARSAWSRFRRRLRVTVGREDAGHATERIRAVTLATVVALCFLFAGALAPEDRVEWLGESPVDQDVAMRTVSLGWFELDGALPVTLVDIDERTWRAWNSPAVTPREALVHLLEAVTAAGPVAVVLDIDLSWGRAVRGEVSGEDPADLALREFLATHAGPPLILPKRVEFGEGGVPRPAASPFDAVVEGNPQVSWAHASFQTDEDGKVREWREWLAVCTDAGGTWLPAIATAVSVQVDLPGVARAQPPGHTDWDCASPSEVAGDSARRLLLGPRLSGPGAHTIGSGARNVSAATLLDAEIARDDRALFADRVVLIGATHESSGDRWLTTAGVLPGVELLANAVRYSALQSRPVTATGEGLRRLSALALFLLYALLDWRYRGLARLVLAVAATLLFVVIAIGLFDDLRAFEAIAAAVVMFIVYKALESAFEFVAELRDERARQPAGPRGLLGALRKTIHAAMRRPHATASGGGHDE